MATFTPDFNFKGIFSEYKIFQALTLVGPPWDNPEVAPLSVLHLDNQLMVIGVTKMFLHHDPSHPSVMQIQSGLENRTRKTERRSKTDQFFVPISTSSDFERSGP